MWVFDGHVDAAEDLIDGVAAAHPTNPFQSVAYARAQRELGASACVLAVRGAGQAVACVGFLRRARMAGALEIPSLPALPEGAADAFWRGVDGFCRANGVWDAAFLSYASDEVALRPVGGGFVVRERAEYVIDLQDAGARLGSNHARNVGRARKLGLVLRRSRDPELADVHVHLMSDSMRRREDRGEHVPAVADPRPFAALLRSGAGELFQMLDGDAVRSSLLLLRAPAGAYYHSAGTTGEGMAQGASHLLVSEIARLLREEGLARFNLGGAGEDNPGLLRFKTGFGARPVRLEAATATFKSPLLRKVRTALRIARHDARRALAAVVRPDRR